MTAKLRHDRAWAALLAAYPKWDLPNASRATWDLLLADIAPEHVLAAALRLGRESKFPPQSCAELREFALEIAGSTTASAAEAWKAVIAAKQIAGTLRYESRPDALDRKRAELAACWPNEAARLAAEAVGYASDWGEGESLGTLRAQFERLYRELVSKAENRKRSEQALQLAGSLPEPRALREASSVGQIARGLGLDAKGAPNA